MNRTREGRVRPKPSHRFIQNFHVVSYFSLHSVTPSSHHLRNVECDWPYVTRTFHGPMRKSYFIYLRLPCVFQIPTGSYRFHNDNVSTCHKRTAFGLFFFFINFKTSLFLRLTPVKIVSNPTSIASYVMYVKNKTYFTSLSGKLK